jgi:hypothetical protein
MPAEPAWEKEEPYFSREVSPYFAERSAEDVFSRNPICYRKLYDPYAAVGALGTAFA